MGMRVVHVMTHDSIGLGEDGPTHQPVEHLGAAGHPEPAGVPPGRCGRDGGGVAAARWSSERRPRCWRCRGRTCRRCAPSDRGRTCGARRLSARASRRRQRDVTLMATGSEVAIALRGRGELLAAEGIDAAVVSLPCFELFEAQDARLPRARCWARRRASPSRPPCAFGWDRYLARGRRLHRHERLRRLGAGASSLRAFRHHRRGGARHAARDASSTPKPRRHAAWPASRCASFSTMPPSTATACRPSTSTTWSRSSRSWQAAAGAPTRR